MPSRLDGATPSRKGLERVVGSFDRCHKRPVALQRDTYSLRAEVRLVGQVAGDSAEQDWYVQFGVKGFKLFCRADAGHEHGVDPDRLVRLGSAYALVEPFDCDRARSAGDDQ